MKRWLLNLAAAVSVVILMAVLVFWPWSHYRAVHAQYFGATERKTTFDCYLVSEFGGLALGFDRNSYSRRSEATLSGVITALPSSERRYAIHLAGFGFDQRTSRLTEEIPRLETRSQDRSVADDDTSRTVRIPYWFIILVALVAPSLFLIRYLGRARLAGHCDVCGYDLRATPERCPECGTIPAADL